MVRLPCSVMCVRMVAGASARCYTRRGTTVWHYHNALPYGTTAEGGRSATAKINVSIPDELLAEVDAIAREFNRSRSGLVAEATERYVAGITEERAAREREARIRAAMASRFARSRSEFPPGPPAEEIIRRDRDTDRGRLLRVEDFK